MAGLLFSEHVEDEEACEVDADFIDHHVGRV